MSDIFEPCDDDIPFTPVPVRARRDGWTEARQRAFIRALQQIGSATTAARSVGKSRRSAYRLRERPGAESFAAAWDEAVSQGFDNVRDNVIDRALNGALVPRFYRDRIVGVRHRYYDSVAVAVLRGGGVDLTERIRAIEDRAARQAFADVERGWERDRADLTAEQYRRIAAEEKLARLVVAGLIGREWLDPANADPPMPEPPPSPLSGTAPRERARRAVPRIRLL